MSWTCVPGYTFINLILKCLKPVGGGADFPTGVDTCTQLRLGLGSAPSLARGGVDLGPYKHDHCVDVGATGTKIPCVCLYVRVCDLLLQVKSHGHLHRKTRYKASVDVILRGDCEMGPNNRRDAIQGC